MCIEEQIASKARALGFAAVGMTENGDTHSFDRYQRWIERGLHAEMNYLDRHASLRRNPAEILPGVRSVVAVAAPYPVNTSPGNGFSTYARGKDYHEILREKLSSLSAWLRNDHGAATRVCVDSAPVLEREWAVRAGLGWIGRQNQVVNPELGCCFFVGILLTDLDLRPSSKIESQCGACRKCLDACPTGAIDEDGFLNARKCISYLTIEHKGEIPEDISAKTGEALFGCDICTSVCPYNPGENRGIPAEFKDKKCPSAEECLAMSDSAFEARFSHTAVQRTGLARLQRNARIALQNAGR